MAVETFDQLIQCAVGADAGKKHIDSLLQTVVFAWRQGPDHGLRFRKIKTNPHRRIKSLIDYQLVGIHHGVVNFVVVDQSQEINYFDTIRLFEY